MSKWVVGGGRKYRSGSNPDRYILVEQRTWNVVGVVELRLNNVKVAARVAKDPWCQADSYNDDVDVVVVVVVDKHDEYSDEIANVIV